jgi:excinuclease ABC subunit C
MRLELAQQALQGNHKQYLQMIDTHIRQYNQELAFEKSAHLAQYKNDLDIIFTTIKTRYHEKRYTDEVAQAITSGYYNDHTIQYGLKKLQEILQLKDEPISIDCFDISHHQSTHIVGSCIRFTHGLPDKEKFRKFKVKSLQSQNDYAALQEIVARRYRDPKHLPDIIMIDGGKGQRNAIAPLFPDVPVISLAKRKELLISDSYPEGLALHVSTPIGKLLIALRDYAHHFAISYHRKRRQKSPL